MTKKTFSTSFNILHYVYLEINLKLMFHDQKQMALLHVNLHQMLCNF